MRKSQDVDRGWAWCVLAASFMIHIMTYGMAWTTGVYNVIFLEAFNQPKGITAWAGALPTAVMYGIGKHTFYIIHDVVIDGFLEYDVIHLL